MSEEVFEDTPFAGYLQNVGAEDWGIEDEDELRVPSAEPEPEPAAADAAADTAAAARERLAAVNSTGLRPLLLSERFSHTRKERFRSLLRSALSQRLSAQETGEFLEQFRYTAMSSDLLRDLPLYTSWSAGTDERRRALLFDTKKPWTSLRFSEPQLVGGGGCVAAIIALLRWRADKSSLGEKEQIALVVALLAVLYLFATARRRLLRSLREKALVCMEEFIVSSKQLDGDVVRALRALQELEVVGAGYAPYGKPPPRVRSARVLGQKLRAVLGSSLHLMCEAYTDAVKDCAGMGSPVEIEQFFEMFGLRDQQADLGFEFNSAYIGYRQPILSGDSRFTQVSELKQALRKVHLARRVFLSCTLAVPSTGECRPAELETWTVLTDHLLNCSQLASQLSNVITKERLSPALAEAESNAPQKGAHPAARSLLELAATVRHLNARLEVMQSAALNDEDYERHESAVSAEMASLNDEWQRLRSRHNKAHAPSVASSPTVVATPQSEDMTAFTAFTAPDLTDCATEATDDSVVQPTVWESVVPASLMPPRSMLSREERIRQMQESREQQASHKPPFDARSSLISELDNVFRHRPRGSRG